MAGDQIHYAPGLKGVIAGETALSYIDGASGRLTYRGFPIEEIVDRGRYAQVAELLWQGRWLDDAQLGCAPLPGEVIEALRRLPRGTNAMDALRTAVSTWGAIKRLEWPPTIEQARDLTRFAPSALAAFARLDEGLEPIDPDPTLPIATGFLFMLSGEHPPPANAEALDAYLSVGAEHGFNASTFTARVIISTRSDLASAVVGAIGALKGPRHGGAPAEVVDQLQQIETVADAEPWIRRTLAEGNRLMGFGHRVYRAYDPRAAALRAVAERLAPTAAWLAKAIAIEEVALRLLAEHKPDYPIRTNVEYYAAAVLQGIGLRAALFPAVFAMARHAGWTAHCIEQAATDILIRPDVRYVGPDVRTLPA
jgi:citrate synthase